METLVNWSALSRLLTGSATKITKTKIPDAYKIKVSNLIAVIDLAINHDLKITSDNNVITL